MVNGDYWIYSDGNGHTILAQCEGAEFQFIDKVVQTCSNNQKTSKVVDQLTE